MSRFEHWPYEACERIRELEATMREVAEELRTHKIALAYPSLFALADRLDSPPVVEKP